MMDQHTFAERFIFDWEDGKSPDPVKTHSLNPADNGNWTSNVVGLGSLVGSQHGVTPMVLARWRGVPVAQITKEVMRALPRAEAADIAMQNFYRNVRLNYLPWCALVASVFDFGWGAGYNKQGQWRANVYLQGLVGAHPDGKISPSGETVQKTVDYLATRSPEAACLAWARVRCDYYEAVIKATPAKAQFRTGWTNRTYDYTPQPRIPSTWWKDFHA